MARAGQAPRTQYARADDGTSIAFQVSGTGPPDLVFVPGWVSHLDLDWDIGGLARFVERLATFARVIRFDRRGTGLSDRVTGDALPTLEQRMDDVHAVMEAAGSEGAVLLGVSEGGPMCLLFAATYPERTAGIVLYGAHATADLPGDEDSFRGELARNPEAFEARLAAEWGEGFGLEYFSPSIAGMEGARQVWARYQRSAASPAAALSILRMSVQADARAALPLVRAPALVIHRRGDRAVSVVHGRYLAEHLPGARYIELDGDDHFWHVGDSDAVLSAIEEFLTGAPARPVEADRVLATVMFTDVVDSTTRAAALGDRRWGQVLDDHDGLVRRHLERFRGREVKQTGDGFLATFDGPARGILCARSIVEGAHGLGLEVRAGLHTGECEVRGEDLGGIAVHIAARVASLAAPGEVLVSGSIPPLVAGSRIEFEDRGAHEFKGVPGAWQVFAVAPGG
jgi:pimeloyl-ACP methyl ester carboxylesterase/class 3 adenylate cyclase